MMYHWGPIDECVIPAVEGRYPEDQMKYFVSMSDFGVVGGGFYVSDLDRDTIVYGSCLIEVHVLLGTPFVELANLSLIASIINPNFTKNDMSTLGSVVPYMFHHYSQLNPWSVFYNVSVLTNVTAGNTMYASGDYLDTLYDSMYPVYRGKATGPKIVALNALLSNSRKITLAVLGADSPFIFADAFTRTPNTIWEALRPNASRADWKLLEDLLLRSRRIGLNDTYANLALREHDFLNIWMPVAMGAPLGLSPSQALRDVPYADFVYATAPYLEYLQQNPFVNVVSFEIVENVTVTHPKVVVFPIYKVSVRGISAYNESDWRKMVDFGLIAEDDPLVKILPDPTISNAANKTQLLIHSALKSVRKWLLAQGSFNETNLPQMLGDLLWILPYKETVVPHWISRAILKYSINWVSLVPNIAVPGLKVLYEFSWIGFLESVHHVRRLFFRAGFVSPLTSFFPRSSKENQSVERRAGNQVALPWFLAYWTSPFKKPDVSRWEKELR